MSEPLLVRCPSCSAMNRVPREKIERALAPVCGSCKALLPARATPIIVTDATFAAEVENAPLPVLVDLWATWCGPCKMIAPALEELAAEMVGRARVAKIDVDANPVTSERLNVRSIPALVIFKQGKEVDRLVGAQPKSEIGRRLERIL